MIKDIKYNGYTAVPSDYECLDGELAGSYNMVPENGAMHPVLPPMKEYNLPVVVSPATGEYKVMFIHHRQSYKHYIVLGPDNKLYYFNEASSFPADVTVPDSYSSVPADTDATSSALAKSYLHKIADTTFTLPKVNTIGNTLIVNDSSGINYFLWTTETTAHYEALGQKPPMLEIKFGLHSDFAVWPEKKNTGDADEEYFGTIINIGNVADGLLPKLGEWGQNQWAKPKGEYTDDSQYDYFKSNGTTYSIEGLAGTTDEEKAQLLKIKSMLTSGVFANLNKFVNDKGVNDNKFVLPFFVRYSYRMYDDSYIMHSYPVLMIPNSRGPVFALDGFRGLQLADNYDDLTGFSVRGRIYGFLSSLRYSIEFAQSTVLTQLEKWKDLITSIDIGVSAPIYTYNQAGEVLGWTNMDQLIDDNTDPWDEYYSIGKVIKLAGSQPTGFQPTWGTAGINKFKDTFISLETFTFNEDSDGNYGDYFNSYEKGDGSSRTYRYPSYIATIPQRKLSEINTSLTSAANFYVIKKFKIEELASDTSEAELTLEDGTLSGLLGRERMTDDYHSHDTLKASLCHPFNGRVNFSDVERTPHNPLNPNVQFTQGGAVNDGATWKVAVSVKNEMQTLTVQSSTAINAINFPHWVFYPDANAKFAYVTKTVTDNETTTTTNYELKLTPHDFLNGAYWLGDITKQDVTPSTAMSDTPPSATTGGFNEENKVYTSNVNNPFVFEPVNINTVGTGKILGICPAVKPLAQDQFGKAPLYVFSDEGVWAMDTTNTGTYSVVWPLAPDVTINYESITQVDDMVYFATNRGIMMITGRQTQCISDEINSDSLFTFNDLFTTTDALNQWKSFLTTNGYIVADGYDTSGLVQVPFSTFLAGCRIIYDYVHQRIIIYNNTKNYAYIYSLKDHKWGMMATDIAYSINSYPDALAVTDSNKVVNLCKDRTVDVVAAVAPATEPTTTPVKVKGIIMTRPLKLDQPDALKTIDTIIQRGKFDHLKSGRTVKPIRTILYGSRDLYNWFMISSSTDHYLRGFSGTPYKYFRIVLLCDMYADESVYGATIQYRPRYLNRPR